MISHSPEQRMPAKADASLASLQVDVIADLVCPWCYLGKRRLDDALAAVHGPSIVNWYPFQLNPGMPAGGVPFLDYLRDKFGDPEKLMPALAELERQGEALHIDFRFDRLSVVPNTMNAHRLMKLAESTEADTSKLADRLLHGFFTDGLDISDRAVLLELGAEEGLERAAIKQALDDDATRQVVLSQEAEVRRSGVTGVPDFLVNRRLVVIGAQSTENLVNVFDRVMFGAESDLEVSPTVH